MNTTTTLPPEIETNEEVAYHGYVLTPRSRAVEANESRGKHGIPANFPEPQSLEQPKGFPAVTYQYKGKTQRPPADGQLMSAGLAPYAVLDEPTRPDGTPWPAMAVTPGGTVQMSWWLTARHKTELWHYYITRDGWDQSKPLTRAMLEPLATIHWHQDKATADWMAPFPINSVKQWLKLPEGKRGRHIIYCVWDVADTAMAFYQGVDVDFGGQA